MKRIIYILQLLTKNLNNSLKDKPILQELTEKEIEYTGKIVCIQTFLEDRYRITIEKL
jgi:hypothetical protein